MSFSKKRKFKVFLGAFLLMTLFFLPFKKGLAEEVPTTDANKPTIVADDQEVVISRQSLDEQNPFVYGSESLKMERTLPFYTTPFSDFKITFDSEDKKFYQGGEEALIGGKISYSSENSEQEVEKIKNDCLSDQKDKTEERRKIICETPPIYYFSDFSDVSILVQVWREEEDRTKMREKGDDLVDEFYAVENILLKEKEEKGFEVKWKAPENLKPGKYYASFFVNQNKRFTLFNFPVNIFAPLTRFDFEIMRGEGDLEGGVKIDKDKIKINDEDYSQVLPAPEVDGSSGKINFKIPVSNPREKEETGTVTYILQRWTQENPIEVITKKEEPLKLAGGSEETLNFEFSPEEFDSVCNLQVVVQSEKTKSMTDIHFVVKGKNRGVIRFLGMGKERSSDDSWPFFCLRNAAWQGAFEGKLKLDFLDGNNQKIKDWEVAGEIEARDGVCFVIKDSAFSNLSKNSCLKMKGSVMGKDEKVTDEEEVYYNCNSAEKANQLQKNEDSFFKITLQKKREALIFLAGLVLIIIVVVFFGIRKYIKNNNKETNEQ